MNGSASRRLRAAAFLALWPALACAQPSPDGARPGNIIGTGQSLDRSVIRGNERVPAASPVVSRVSAALQAVGTGQTAEAIRLIDAAVPEAAQADIPK